MMKKIIATIIIINSLMNAQNLFIRTNQLGFLPSDIKSGVALSKIKLDHEKIRIFNGRTDELVFEDTLAGNYQEYGNFKYGYQFDFSELDNLGSFYIQIRDERSYSFNVGYRLYNKVVDELIKFFRIQRCGYTNPEGHSICHIADATSIIDGSEPRPEEIDVTGGWHDAGDYTKFLNTTAYTTYTLLFAYDFDTGKFNIDNDNDNIPDLLQEAKIGLDWLLRANYKNKEFVTQVQDLRDHGVGWRMPEDDPLQFDRPAFIGIGKNLIGIYTAALALGARIWRDYLHYDEFADKCLETAETFYSIINEVPDVDSSGSGMYIDKNFKGKLALGAAELYLTTKRIEFLRQAMHFADDAGSDYWWSWGDINAFADYRLAKFNPKYLDYLKANLDQFNSNRRERLFGEGVPHSWGTNNTIMGIAAQAIMYKKLTKDETYDSLSLDQRDFILGKNPWGVSFITKIGANYSRNLHHQISYLKKILLPGGFAAGPIPKEALDSYNIPYESADNYSLFQSDEAVYRDERNDFVTNEPTITANATAIFVMGHYSGNR